ncbi:MAG TPA: DUF4136 domain-containing protein [Verrucomicrobiae bacterium]|nr:DUF4136 domain-containing protein [Verrucomicrobiae bacterium]
MRLLCLGLLLVPAVFAQKVEIEFDQNLDFSRFHTFAIRNGRLNSKNPSLNSELIRKRLDADIHRFLEARGLVYLAEGKPDLNIVYTLGALRKAELEAYPAGWRGWGTRVVRVPYTEGTLVLDLRDTSTRSLAWRAIVREEKSDAAKIEAKLDDMVKKAIEKYPPKIKD